MHSVHYIEAVHQVIDVCMRVTCMHVIFCYDKVTGKLSRMLPIGMTLLCQSDIVLVT